MARNPVAAIAPAPFVVNVVEPMRANRFLWYQVWYLYDARTMARGRRGNVGLGGTDTDNRVCVFVETAIEVEVEVSKTAGGECIGRWGQVWAGRGCRRCELRQLSITAFVCARRRRGPEFSLLLLLLGWADQKSGKQLRRGSWHSKKPLRAGASSARNELEAVVMLCNERKWARDPR